MKMGPLILGASGRVGRMLHQLWRQGALDFGGVPLWQYRKDAPGQADHKIIWDMLADPAPDIAPSGVICLAGPTAGPDLGPDLGMSQDLALAALDAADGAPLLYASSQAVYGAQSGLLSETAACDPGAYGAAKLEAERVLAPAATATCLRIGNIVGADMLLMNAQAGPVSLDQFPNGKSPQRMMIGVQTFGLACAALLAKGQIAAPVLNLAQPGAVEMADMLRAANQAWTWQAAPDTALASLTLDLAAIQAVIDLPQADPATLVAEARLAGWGQGR